MHQKFLFITLLIIGSAVVGTAQTAGLKSFYNKGNKVGLKYPANWKLTKQNDDGKDIHLGWFEPPKASLRGQLRNASVGLWIDGATVDEPECLSFRDEEANWQQEKAVARKIGNLTLYQRTASDGAAGSVGVADYYRIFHGGHCYTLKFETFKINSPKDDRYVKAVKRQFDAMLHSFYFGK